jgi:hypothetical protein
MNKQLVISILTISFSSFAFAKDWDVQFENQKLGVVSFPDDWNVDQSMEIIDAWSPDKAAHMHIEVVPLREKPKSSQNDVELPGGGHPDEIFAAMDEDKDTDQFVDSTIGYFKDDDVILDEKTKKKRGSQTIGELKGYTFEGTREGKPLDAGVGVVSAKGKAVIFNYWCLKEKHNERAPEIMKVLQGIKAIQSKAAADEKKK